VTPVEYLLAAFPPDVSLPLYKIWSEYPPDAATLAAVIIVSGGWRRDVEVLRAEANGDA
jgi:hypothetical protein